MPSVVAAPSRGLSARFILRSGDILFGFAISPIDEEASSAFFCEPPRVSDCPAIVSPTVVLMPCKPPELGCQHKASWYDLLHRIVPPWPFIASFIDSIFALLLNVDYCLEVDVDGIAADKSKARALFQA